MDGDFLVNIPETDQGLVTFLFFGEKFSCFDCTPLLNESNLRLAGGKIRLPGG